MKAWGSDLQIVAPRRVLQENLPVFQIDLLAVQRQRRIDQRDTYVYIVWTCLHVDDSAEEDSCRNSRQSGPQWMPARPLFDAIDEQGFEFPDL